MANLACQVDYIWSQLKPKQLGTSVKGFLVGTSVEGFLAGPLEFSRPTVNLGHIFQ